MNATYTTSLQTRLVAFAVALLTSAVVLGGTVAGMQPRDDGSTERDRAGARHGARALGELSAARAARSVRSRGVDRAAV